MSSIIYLWLPILKLKHYKHLQSVHKRLIQKSIFVELLSCYSNKSGGFGFFLINHWHKRGFGYNYLKQKYQKICSSTSVPFHCGIILMLMLPFTEEPKWGRKSVVKLNQILWESDKINAKRKRILSVLQLELGGIKMKQKLRDHSLLAEISINLKNGKTETLSLGMLQYWLSITWVEWLWRGHV